MRLQCPRCATVVDAPSGRATVCPTCGFGAGAPVPAPPQPPPPYRLPYPAYGTPLPPPVTSTRAQASLWCGVAALVIWVFPFLGMFLAFGAGIAAIILGVTALPETRGAPPAKGGHGMAVAGIVLGGVATALGAMALLFVFAFFGGAFW